MKSAVMVMSAGLLCSAALAQEVPRPAATTAAPRIASALRPAQSCVSSGGLSFVCGFKGPEDMVLVPGTRWLIAGGVVPGGGLRLVDTTARTASALAFGVGQRNSALQADCAGAPDPATFSAHGLSLRPAGGAGRFRLYVVGHAPEAIQVFALDARGERPAIAWTGCVPLPTGLSGNAVTALADGTILATVRGASLGVPTDAAAITGGAIAAWKPGDAGWRVLEGTRMAGPNGIEVSPDDREFYVASSGTQTVSVFSLADPSKPMRQARAPLTSLDNLRWTGGRLIAAGMIADEPACGGTRMRILQHGGDAHACIRGYAAVELDPATMDWRVVAYAEPNPSFDGVATAVPVGNTLWLSSYDTDRIAYRPLPGAQ